MMISFILPATLLSDHIIEITLISTTAALILLSHGNKSKLPLPVWPRPIAAWRRGSRSYALVYTCVCIYAVDLPIFPRRFAKTELDGVSLMDTGVGLIALITGISNADFITRAPSLISRQVIRSTLPLIVIGLARTVIVKTLGYQEHVSEYGIHWNFFITLAVLRVRILLKVCDYVITFGK